MEKKDLEENTFSRKTPEHSNSSLFKVDAKDIEGRWQTLGEYKGKVMLIVNVASKCGFTYQYEALEALYQKYKDQGFVVIGFPSNDFLRQEPGTDEEIQTFCSENYSVSFSMYSKVRVKGKNMHPLYRYLTDKKTNPEHSGRITWNFNKFLIDRDGGVVDRFASKTEPGSPEMIGAIENALKP
jgi:glutathione peroxidase